LDSSPVHDMSCNFILNSKYSELVCPSDCVCGWNMNVPTTWWRHKNYVKEAIGLCTLVLKCSLCLVIGETTPPSPRTHPSWE
jgi:hypothetical protein